MSKSKLFFVAAIMTLALTVLALFASVSLREVRAQETEGEYTLTLYGASAEIFVSSGDSGAYQSLTPTETSGSGKDVINTYDVTAGAQVKVSAVENTSGDNNFFVAWDYQYINGRVGELGATEYEFTMPEEDCSLWAQYTDGASIGIDGKATDANTVTAINGLNEDDADYVGKKYDSEDIVNGKAYSATAADPDLFGLNGKRIKIPSDTAKYSHMRIKGSTISSMNGRQAVYYRIKNNSSVWTVTVRIFLESYSAICSDPGPMTIAPGQTLEVTTICDLGFSNGYPTFAVDDITGSGTPSPDDIITLDIVGLCGEAYPVTGDPSTVPPDTADLVKVGFIAGNKDQQYNSDTGVLTEQSTNYGNNRASLHRISNLPAYDPENPEITIYVKFTSLANEQPMKAVLATSDTIESIVDSYEMPVNTAGTKYFELKATRTGDTDLYIGICNQSGAQAKFNLYLQAAYNDAFKSDVTGLGVNSGYTVTDTEGVPTESTAIVPYGESYSFKVELDDAYSLSQYTVKANGITLRPSSDGVYTLRNVTEDTAVTVDGLSVNNYTVSGLTGLGYSITITEGSASVAHGGSIKFTVDAKNEPPYTVGELVVSYTGASGEPTVLHAADGVYSIDNITSNINISVSGISVDGTVVSGLAGENFTAVSDDIVIEGDGRAILDGDAESFTFSVIPNTGYSVENMIVKVGDSVITADQGIYAVQASSAVENEIAISITGIVEEVYDITYVLESGENLVDADAPTTFTVNSNNIILTDAAKAGYTFEGWYDSESGGNLVTTIYKGTANDITLYPKFTAVNYTLTYITDGGEWADGYLKPETFTVNDTVSLPSGDNLQKEGYTFDGWYEGNTKYTQIAAGTTSNITLTARWTLITYNIDYDIGAGEWAEGYEAAAQFTVEDSVTLPASENLVREGYTFSHWINAEGVRVNAINRGTADDVSLTAVWVPAVYRLTYELDGGTFRIGNPDNYTIESATITLNNPVKPGYTFVGWTYDGVTDPALTVTINGSDLKDYTFVAHWELTRYTITYVGADVDQSYPASYQITDSDIVIPAIDDDSFIGWISDFSSTPQKTFTIHSGSAQNITLTAVWANDSDGGFEEKDVYSVTFSSNGGTSVATQYVVSGEKATAPADPTWEGAAFAGWYTDAECTKAFDFNTAITEDMILYAKWDTEAGGCSGDISGIGIVFVGLGVVLTIFVIVTVKKRKTDIRG